MPTFPSFRYLILTLTMLATTLLQASCNKTATRTVQGSTATVANVCEQNLTTFVSSCGVGERAIQGTLNDCEALPNVTNTMNILYIECIAGKARNQGYMDACPLDRTTISLGVNNHQALENLEVGGVVAYVAMAHMGDDSAILSFSLSNSEYFEVNASGAIKLKKALDYETTAEYNLTLTVTNGAGISRREALNIEVEKVAENAPKLVESKLITEFTYSGDANWTEDNDTYSTPTGSWKNEDINDDESACMEATVNKDENILVLFAYKVSSESCCDKLKFYIDDTEKNSYADNTWIKTSYPLSSGEHTLKWCYSKDNSDSGGDDTAWVDDIKIIEMYTLAENTELGELSITIEIVPQDNTVIDSFSIDGNGSEKFEIATDGTLSLVAKLDYETQREYTLLITAHNLAGDSNTVTRTITVTDVDSDLYITNAFYDDNGTAGETTDDRLLLQYSKPLDEASIQDSIADNYTINQNETIDSSPSTTAKYNSTKKYYHHIISLVDPITLKEQNISIATSTLTDLARVDADSTKTLIRATTGSKKLKKTGQVKSYDERGVEAYFKRPIKDDGYYQSGVIPHYSRDDENNTVTDHITGLMWADDTNVSSVTKPWLTTENYNDCKDNGNNCENTDSDPSNPDDDTATEYCETLGLGGFNNWRLPSINELIYIADINKKNPAIDSVFKNVVSSFYYSSNTDIGIESNAWGISFYRGSDYWSYKSDSQYIRCTRDGQ